MSLPIDIAGVMWFTPTAVWEWEDDSAANAPADDQALTAALAAATPAIEGGPSGSGTANEPGSADAPPARRLVFKGYTYETRFSWIPCDSLLSRPWVHSRDDNAARRKNEPEPPIPIDETPPTQDDGPADT